MLSALFSSSASGSDPEKQLRIRKSQALLCSPCFCAYPAVCVEGDHCIPRCHTKARFPSVVWDLGHGFLSNARNNPACLSSANCQAPRVLLSPSSQTGAGPGASTASLQQPCQRPCSQPSQPLCQRTRGGAHSWFTGVLTGKQPVALPSALTPLIPAGTKGKVSEAARSREGP